MTATLMEQLNDNEYELLVEALYALRANKTAALQEAGLHAATRSFTARDFGIPKIDALLTRLDAKVPMDEADAVIANATPVTLATVSPLCQAFACTMTESHVQAAAEAAWRKQHLGAEYADASQQTKWHWEEIAREVFRHAPAAPAAEVGIRLEGGVIQSIWGNQSVNVLVIDYDTEDRQEDELFDLPQDDGRTSPCVIVEYPADVMPDENARIRDARIAREPQEPRP